MSLLKSSSASIHLNDMYVAHSYGSVSINDSYPILLSSAVSRVLRPLGLGAFAVGKLCG